jgi:hypothetical protein
MPPREQGKLAVLSSRVLAPRMPNQPGSRDQSSNALYWREFRRCDEKSQ